MLERAVEIWRSRDFNSRELVVNQRVWELLGCLYICNEAVYTAISVACGWAGAVISRCKPRNSEIRDRKLATDQQTDGPTDWWTDIASFRVACTRLKRDKQNSLPAPGAGTHDGLFHVPITFPGHVLTKTKSFLERFFKRSIFFTYHWWWWIV